MLFEPYARDLAGRLAGIAGRVLETAAGTGIVTRALVQALPPDIAITATDLNQPMLDHAAQKLDAPQVAWRQANALSLPFEDSGFEAVVCQFGVMFFPDKAAGFAEARRVLRPGGRFLMAVWTPGWAMFAVANVFSLLLTSKARWRGMAADAGFNAVDEGTFNNTWFVLLEKPIAG